MGWRGSVRIAAGLLLTIVLASCPDPTLNMREADTTVGPEARPVRSDDQDSAPEAGDSLPPLQITWFSFTFPPDAATDRPEIEARGAINHDSREITVTIPAGESRDGLVPTILHNGTAIEPLSSAVQNFSSPVIYTITRPVADDGEDTGDEGTAGEEPEIEEVSYTVSVLVEGGADEPVFARFFESVELGGGVTNTGTLHTRGATWSSREKIASLNWIAFVDKGQDIETGHQIYEFLFFGLDSLADTGDNNPSRIINTGDSSLGLDSLIELNLNGTGPLVWMRTLSPFPESDMSPLEWFLDSSSTESDYYYMHLFWPDGMAKPDLWPFNDPDYYQPYEVSPRVVRDSWGDVYPLSVITHLYVAPEVTVNDYAGGPFLADSDEFWYWVNGGGNLVFPNSTGFVPYYENIGAGNVYFDMRFFDFISGEDSTSFELFFNFYW